MSRAFRSPAPQSYTIGGTVSGLSGTGLVLQNNGGNNLSVSANGRFTFTTAIASGSTYNVTVFRSLPTRRRPAGVRWQRNGQRECHERPGEVYYPTVDSEESCSKGISDGCFGSPERHHDSVWWQP